MQEVGAMRENKQDLKNTSEPLNVKIIKGDGNCLFRALLFAITGGEDQHTVVRNMVCDFMACNEGSKMESVRNDKVWGTTTEILAAANMFNVNICVWAKSGPELT
uniref:OTU domain-containing protein n=1 Tax=Scylla olivacea TaxID=85551 RepID=A0A0N7ZBW4_SCYOL